MPSGRNGSATETIMTFRPALIVAHVAAICALALLACLYALAPEPARIEVDLAVSAGTNIEVFLNDLSRKPLTQPLVPGERRRYVFEGVLDDITLLRLDPTDANAATVELYSIVVRGREGILAQFGPQAVAGWSSSALTTTGVDGTALRMRSTTGDPILITRTAIALQRGGRWKQWLPLVNVPDIAWRVAAASVILLLIAAAVDPARRLHLPLAVAGMALTAIAVALVTAMGDAPGAANVAVSRATFVGLSVRPAIVLSVVLLVGSVVLGAATAWIRRRTSRAENEEPAAPPMGRWAMVGGVLVIAILSAPDLAAVAEITATRQFVPHWDSDNLLFWAYRVHQGDLPYRDFWYPYGGTFAFDLPLSTGPVIRWLYDAVLFSTFFVAFGRWCGTGAATLATALLLTGYRFDMFPHLERYLLGANLVLAYVAVVGTSRVAARVPFWIACASAMFLEPPQLLYAGIPVSLIVVTDAVDYWRRDPVWRQRLSRRLLADFGVPVALAVISCGALAASGQLGGALGFYGRLGDVVAYTAWGNSLPAISWMLKDEQQSFPLGLLTVLIVVGTYEWIARDGHKRYGQAVAGMGVLTLMTMQKAFTRGLGDQILVTVFCSIVVLALGWPGRRRTTDYVVAGAILGGLCAMFVARPGASHVVSTVATSLGRAVADVRVMAMGGDAVDQANRVRYAPERFVRYATERQVVERLRAHAGPGGDVRVFAVTDNPILYVLTGQPRVWMANLYNGSPVYEQTRMMRWLQQENPPYAVLNRDRLMWDGFQLVVRNPLVFAEAADRYVPFDSMGPIDLLQRRAAAEPVALSYWRDRLGADVNVGRLASVSSFGRAAACAGTCADLLDVGVSNAGKGPVQVPMRVGDLSFSVTFSLAPGETAYHVLLDRVWFWRAAQRSNLPRRLGELERPGVRASIRPIPIDERVLY